LARDFCQGNRRDESQRGALDQLKPERCDPYAVGGEACHVVGRCTDDDQLASPAHQPLALERSAPA